MVTRETTRPAALLMPRLVEAFLALFATLEACAQPLQERQVALTCRWAVGSNAPVETSVVVDLQNKTFNGQPAQIADAEVRATFSSPNGSGVELIINRYTGNVSGVATDRWGPAPVSGSCVRTSQSK
jgi:hypothetical protein